MESRDWPTLVGGVWHSLEDGVITAVRVQNTLTFPVACILIGTMNPCPCPYKGQPEQKCVSSPGVFDRVLRVGRTIAGLAGDEADAKVHLAEAVQYWEREGG